MWQVVVFTGLALAIGQSVQAPPALAGRWRLADAVVNPAAASELFVMLRPSSRLSVERRFASGVEFANFTLASRSGAGQAGTAASTAFPNTAVVSTERLTLSVPAAFEGVAKTVGHEEIWSLTGRDTLIVQITQRPTGGNTRGHRLTYVRVPRPALAVPGTNLLENGTADKGFAFWYRRGDAVVDKGTNPAFRIRSGAECQQQVSLPSDAAGKFVVLIGSGSSERVNADGGITGRPYLYALVGSEDGYRILAHLQGQNLGARATFTGEWVTMSGIFRVPPGASELSLQLHQGSARGVPDNGSAGMFDDLGVYLFPTEDDARTFVENWRGRAR
jgi:hypothetical protein